MEDAFVEILNTLAGTPASVGLLVTAAAIFLTSDWRLSLTALLVQYILLGLAVTRSAPMEIGLVKILAGVLAVFILYLSARKVQEMAAAAPAPAEEPPGLRPGWDAGPLGLPLRLLTLLLVVLAVMLAFERVHVPFMPADLVLAALWLVGLALASLVIGHEPLRVGPAALSILAAFDLVYGGFASNLAVVGSLGALTLLAALAFAYLVIIQGMTAQAAAPALGGSERAAGPVPNLPNISEEDRL